MAQTDDTLTDLSIAAAAAQLRSRSVSPVELTEAYLERIERLNPAINAYVTVTGERARADARRAAEEIAKSGPRGPLHGVPIALKDLCDTAGIRTTAGGKFFADHVPKADCAVARRLREAGSVLLGKLNTHEFAYGVTTDNPHFGATRNPWDQSRIPGGSSGGSGAAIAASLAAGTIGTDTGGSIRIPASLCGAVGLKPSYGRVSKAGIFPLSFIFDHAGPITRTVEDAAIMLEAIAGYDAADPTSERVPVDRYTQGLARGAKGLRLGVPRRYFYERLDPEVGAALESALGVLGSIGASVQDVELPSSETAITSLFGLVLAEAKHIHAERLSARPQDFGADVVEILSQATPDRRRARRRDGSNVRAHSGDARGARDRRRSRDADDADSRRQDRAKERAHRRRRGIADLRDDSLYGAVQRDSPSRAFGALRLHSRRTPDRSPTRRKTVRRVDRARRRPCLRESDRMAPAKAGAVARRQGSPPCPARPGGACDARLSTPGIPSR